MNGLSLQAAPGIVAGLAVLLSVLVGQSANVRADREAESDTSDELPAGVEQIVPRGAIPAVFEPEFVSAQEAGIPDDAWILGVAIGGEARAYSLNLLNGYEIVNDQVGGRPIAAVW